MRRCSLMLALGMIAALSVAHVSPSPAEPAKKTPSLPARAAGKPADDWKADPVCQMVFFAVLEGLYGDGVSSEAADSVLGRTKGSVAEIRQTFVIECPLCHPVYEAFRLYQQRPAFAGGKRDTFGKGLEPTLERDMRSKGLHTRQHALQTVVHRWVERRLTQMRLSALEKKHWAARLEERSGQGNTLLTRLRGTDSWYAGWGYGFCAACKGCTAVSDTLKSPDKK